MVYFFLIVYFVLVKIKNKNTVSIMYFYFFISQYFLNFFIMQRNFMYSYNLKYLVQFTFQISNFLFFIFSLISKNDRFNQINHLDSRNLYWVKEDIIILSMVKTRITIHLYHSKLIHITSQCVDIYYSSFIPLYFQFLFMNCNRSTVFFIIKY